MLLPGVIWLALLFLVPLCVVIAVAFATTDIINRPVFGWHPSNFRLVVDPLYLRLLVRSVAFAALTTLICLVVGYPVAYTIARFGGRYRNALIGIVVLPWLIDYLVRIYAWVVILGNEGIVNSLLRHLGITGTPPLQLTNTPIAVIVGLVYAYFPLMVLPLYATLEQLDLSLIEAGKDLFGTPRSTFWHVTLPFSTPGIVAGSLLVFLPCVGDFATARLLGGTSTYMIGNLISDQFQQSGNWPFGAAITVVVMALMWLVILAYLIYAWRQGRKGLEVV